VILDLELQKVVDRRNRDRVRDLSKSGIAPQSELDTAEAANTVALAKHETALEEARTRMAALAQRRAEYDFAQKQLADTAIVAPFDGAVQSRKANLGEYVTTGAPVLEVVRTDPLRLRLEVPERSSTLVQTGQTVRLWVEADTNAYSGVLTRLSPALEEAAMDLGATDWQAFIHVVLPALAPGIVAAALLALTVSFDDYVITSMVAGVDSETLPMVIYAMARRGASPVINAISAIIVVVFGALILISERMTEGAQK
jgi:multidrug efflux pump subunit AcrA (membrane-fusion protein)